MEIGQRVRVKAFAFPSYRNNIRKWERRKSIVDIGWYVGYTFKHEGRYHSESAGGGILSLEPEYEPAHLSVTNSVKLLRIKTSERSNDKFAFPEDVEVI